MNKSSDELNYEDEREEVQIRINLFHEMSKKNESYESGNSV